MDLSRFERFAEVKKNALEMGAYRAELIQANQIVVDERVRLKCQIPLCPHYGNSLRCPPNTMPVAEFRSVLARYSCALVLQVVSYGIEEKTLAATERKAQLMLGELEKKALGLGFYFAAGLGASNCRICEECVGARSGLPCRNPSQARPSAEAMGIDVIKTAGEAGLSFGLDNPKEVVYTGILLLD